MRRLISIIAIYFCLSAPLASALSDSDKTTIENACKAFVDNGLAERIEVAVQPPDGITYLIMSNSPSDVDRGIAVALGVWLFSSLTYYHPEVTKGTIGLFYDVPTGGSRYAFVNIYPSDLWPITDRKNPTLAEASQVGVMIVERAVQEKQ
jgi:hypothetical protein